MHEITPPTIEEIREVMERRRRTRMRAAQGVLTVAALGTVGYIGLRAASNDPAELVIAGGGSTSMGTSLSTTEPSTAVPPSTLTPGCTAPGPIPPEGQQPGWFIERADRFILGAGVTGVNAALDLSTDWQLDAIESKALLDATGWPADPSSGDKLDGLIAAFDAAGYDRDDAAAIAKDWHISPTVTMALAAAQDPTVVQALQACADR